MDDRPAAFSAEQLEQKWAAAREKTATLGGEVEQGFEQAFSSLAYAYLKDKAPRLLDYLVGFQLVDRNDDNTKAVAVFGFKLGSQWLYAPVFFLNGDLKGHELLYIKDQDTFVPMKENWVNYLMNRKPHVLGQGSGQDAYQLGGMSPDMRALSGQNGMFGKRSSADQPFDDWVMPAVPAVAALLAGTARFTDLDPEKVASDPFGAAVEGLTLPTLDDFLGSNFGMLKAAFDLSEAFPSFREGVQKFYGPNCWTRWGLSCREKIAAERRSIMPTKQASAPVKKASDPRSASLLAPINPQDVLPAHPLYDGSLRIVKSAADAPDDLDGDQRAQLLRAGYLVMDKRAEETKSVAYRTEEGEQALMNPTETGIYSVLEKPGDFSKMLVVHAPMTASGPLSHAIVVRAGGNKTKNISFLASDKGHIWVEPVKTGRTDDEYSYEKWWKSLPEGPGRDGLKEDGLYMVAGEDKSISGIFRIQREYGQGRYKAYFFAEPEFGFEAYDATGKYKRGLPSFATNGEDELVTIGSEDQHWTKLRRVGNELRVPKGYKIITLQSPSEAKTEYSSCCILKEEKSPTDADALPEDLPISPGSLADIQLLMTEKTSALKIYNSGTEAYVRSYAGEETMPVKAAFLHLIEDHGLSEDVARTLLKEAQLKKSVSCRIGYAPGFGPREKEAYGAHFEEPDYGYEQFGQGGGGVMTQDQMEYEQPIDGLSASDTDPAQYDIWSNYTYEQAQDPMATAQQAAQEGQKEVFDTAAISGLLKAVRPDNQVDRYLGDIMKGVDRYGRILLMYYWHPEDFEDRYGKSDLPELEDGLRNAFETGGDVLLFLKEKTIEAPLGEAGEINIDEAARN